MIPKATYSRSNRLTLGPIMSEALTTLAALVMMLLSSPAGIIIALVVIGLAIWAPRFRWGLAMICLILVGGYLGLSVYGSGQQYRDCVAQIWDRKHPEVVKARAQKEWQRECAMRRLRGQTPCTSAESPFTADDITPVVRPAGPCGHLSMEELRRADAEASRAQLLTRR